jgi:hypothetical protein
VCRRRRSSLLTGEGERGGGGAQSYDGKKVCPLYIIQYSLRKILKLKNIIKVKREGEREKENQGGIGTGGKAGQGRGKKEIE